MMESSGETPQWAAVDDKDQIAFCSGNTNPRKLPQLRIVESIKEARDLVSLLITARPLIFLKFQNRP
jgi:hypothetical protein